MRWARNHHLILPQCLVVRCILQLECLGLSTVKYRIRLSIGNIYSFQKIRRMLTDHSLSACGFSKMMHILSRRFNKSVFQDGSIHWIWSSCPLPGERGVCGVVGEELDRISAICSTHVSISSVLRRDDRVLMQFLFGTGQGLPQTTLLEAETAAAAFLLRDHAVEIGDTDPGQ